MHPPGDISAAQANITISNLVSKVFTDITLMLLFVGINDCLMAIFPFYIVLFDTICTNLKQP